MEVTSVSEESSSDENSGEEESSSLSSSASISSEEKKERLNPMDEPYIGRQYYLNHIGDIYSTWDTYRGDGVTIAVIDSGFNPYHEDFYYEDGSSKVLATSASFEYGDGLVKTSVGLESVKDLGNSHGTFCAGVAAAAINKKGVAGVAPDASLLLLKTDCKPKSIEKAFYYAVEKGAKVITISIGSYYNYKGDLVDDGSDLSNVFNNAISYCREHGTVVISAGGNGGLDNMPNEYTWPGATPGVIGVGGLAANSSGEIWSGSSYNSSPDHEFCDVFAPAEDMFGCCHYDGKTYDSGWKGTSFASPQVAGMAALYFEKYPNASVDKFESDLYASCHAITTSSKVSSSNCGKGRVDVGKLLSTNSSESITMKVKTSWQNCYCYAWNLETNKALEPWPGKKMDGNGTFSLTLDAATYPNVLFTKGSDGPQSADLLTSSFKSGHTYDLTNADSSNSYLVGSYTS